MQQIGECRDFTVQMPNLVKSIWKKLVQRLQKRTAVKAAFTKFMSTMAWKQTLGLAGLETLVEAHVCFMCSLAMGWKRWTISGLSTHSAFRILRWGGEAGRQLKQPAKGPEAWQCKHHNGPNWLPQHCRHMTLAGLAWEVWANTLQVPPP